MRFVGAGGYKGWPKLPEETTSRYDNVGPVLQAGPLADAIVAAIRDLNRDVIVVDRGAYVRVLAPRICTVTRASIEKHLGRQMRFPGELETVLSAFKGSIQLTQNEAVWQFKSASDTDAIAGKK